MNYEKELAKAKLYATKQYNKQKIKAIKHKFDCKKPLSYSKVALIFILANCTVVEIYAMIVMFVLEDLSALSALIAAVVTESISLCVYFIKSALENRANGITYETTMRQLENNNEQSEVVG